MRAEVGGARAEAELRAEQAQARVRELEAQARVDQHRLLELELERELREGSDADAHKERASLEDALSQVRRERDRLASEMVDLRRELTLATEELGATHSRAHGSLDAIGRLLAELERREQADTQQRLGALRSARERIAEALAPRRDAAETDAEQAGAGTNLE